MQYCTVCDAKLYCGSEYHRWGCREQQADAASAKMAQQDLAAKVTLLEGQLDEAKKALRAAERGSAEARARLDAKRQKKRAWKATAAKFQRLWESVCCIALPQTASS